VHTEPRALSAAAAASRLASSSSFVTLNGAPFMTAWCSGHFPPCMAVRRECTRNRCISRSESSVACGRVCACSGVRCPSFRVPRGRRRAAGSPPAVRPSRRRNAATVSRPIQAARRTRHGLGQGAQHAASVDARRGITQGAHGARGAVWQRECGVVLAERRALSAAAAVVAALLSGPSSSFTTSNVAPFSAA
jgi:hypothetical protein